MRLIPGSGKYAEDWSSWHDPYWDWSESYVAEQPEEPSSADAEDPAIKEAQQAERVAESLALEAQRTWSEAQRATAALRKDRGFGQHPSLPGQKGKGCWICNGPHMAKDCPDRRHPSMMKGKFKGKQPTCLNMTTASPISMKTSMLVA